jgi:hypothetical protein
MQRTSINPEILQPMFEAAANAAQKGQSQFVTPIPFGRKLAEALPRHRPALVDLNCGPGHLLEAAALPNSLRLFGADIDPCRGQSVEGAGHALNRLTSDITVAYPWFKEVDFTADLFVLNPPWRLFLYRERLAGMAESTLPAVRMAFKGVESGIPAGTIDSTIAMLLIALDLCTAYGEGLLIANNNTLERLLFAPGAPHSAVVKHCWARLVVPGNPMTGIADCQWQEGEQFETGVLYFAREHITGPKTWRWPELPGRVYRQGAELRNVFMSNVETASHKWQAVRERAAEAQGRKPKTPWNLWLEAGVIQTALSLFEKHSRKINKREVERLFALEGKAPMELVLQRTSRDELQRVASEAGWRVQPALLAAIDQAVHEYQAERAPLYPLPEIQRLGYLDEENTIECKTDLANAAGRVIFRAGQRYPLRTQTVAITRNVEKPNAFTGELEDLEYSGQELAFFIVDHPVRPGVEHDSNAEPEGDEFSFMDARLKDDPNTHIPNAKRAKHNQNQTDPVDFTLQQLCAHFHIPDVPDVATVNPAGYQAHLESLAALETLASLRS